MGLRDCYLFKTETGGRVWSQEDGVALLECWNTDSSHCVEDGIPGLKCYITKKFKKRSSKEMD